MSATTCRISHVTKGAGSCRDDYAQMTRRESLRKQSPEFAVVTAKSDELRGLLESDPNDWAVYIEYLATEHQISQFGK